MTNERQVTRQELIDTFRTGNRPFGEDFASLITECYDRLYAVDNWSIIETNGVIGVNIDGVSISVNQDGKLEATGLTGPTGATGATGPKGDPGEDGRDGNSFIISKVYNSTNQMNLDFYGGEVKRGQFVVIVRDDTEYNDHGDVYIKGTTQYEFLNNIKDADGIKGERGPAGPQGPKGDPGNTIGIVDDFSSNSSIAAASARTVKVLKEEQISHETMPADNSNFGHVKIGSGINVSDGLITVPQKEYYMGGFNNVIFAQNTDWFPHNTFISSGIHSISLGQGGGIRLRANKVYRVTVTGSFAGAALWSCEVSLYNKTTGSRINNASIDFISNTFSHNHGFSNTLDVILTFPVDTTISIRNTYSMQTVYFQTANRSRVIVQEI